MLESGFSSGSVVGGRFEIERLAGHGGMGSVYRALDRQSGNRIALKLLRSGGSGSAEGERFQREAQILAELRHPSIVSYVAHGQAQDGQRFLAMEWLEGEDLDQRLRRGPLSLRDSMLLLGEVAGALSLAHQHGVIHRDRTHKTKIWLRYDDSAIQRRRTDDAFALLSHSPSWLPHFWPR